MTRKQAILQAIQSLSREGSNIDVINKLKEIYNEMPLSMRTKSSIIDCVETYAEEHDGMFPYINEFRKKNGLPSTTVIFSKFNISSIDDFYNQYFTHLKHKIGNGSPYYDKDMGFFLDTFKSEYEKMREKFNTKIISHRKYNKNRSDGVPNAETVMRQCNCDTYTELLELCGFKKKAQPLSLTMDVSYNNEDSGELNELITEIVKKRDTR